VEAELEDPLQHLVGDGPALVEVPEDAPEHSGRRHGSTQERREFEGRRPRPRDRIEVAAGRRGAWEGCLPFKLVLS
jgi:hypothetical protein